MSTVNNSLKNDFDSEGSTPGISNSVRGDVTSAVTSILDAAVVSRATTKPNTNTRSNANTSKNNREEVSVAANSILDATIVDTKSKYSKRTKTRKQRQSQQHHAKESKPPSSRYEFPFATSYKSHPALSNVALAQALWASVIRPNFDSIIDATCGNGNDSIVLAEMLFGDESSRDNGVSAELLCLDVQTTACERTSKALREVLPSGVRIVTGTNNEPLEDEDAEDDYSERNSKKIVRIMKTSHETLPRPTEVSSVGLIVYNLGWLPGIEDSDNNNGKDCVTTMETTIRSMTGATSLLRVGGMLSVITYPQSGPDEDTAVRLFVTCLALLSSRTRTWEEAVASFLEDRSIPTGGEREISKSSTSREAIAKEVTLAMEAVVERGVQTWRVSQHDKLGMDRPPILFTATRIK